MAYKNDDFVHDTQQALIPTSFLPKCADTQLSEPCTSHLIHFTNFRDFTLQDFSCFTLYDFADFASFTCSTYSSIRYSSLHLLHLLQILTINSEQVIIASSLSSVIAFMIMIHPSLYLLLLDVVARGRGLAVDDSGAGVACENTGYIEDISGCSNVCSRALRGRLEYGVRRRCIDKGTGLCMPCCPAQIHLLDFPPCESRTTRFTMNLSSNRPLRAATASNS